jgi:hypothetical protein
MATHDASTSIPASGYALKPGWQFVDHCCRSCMGRISTCEGVYRCGGCGNEGRRADAVCVCGLTVDGLSEKRQGPRIGGRPGRKSVVEVTEPKIAGFRCGKNPKPSRRMPYQIIAFLDGQPYEPHEDQ